MSLLITNGRIVTSTDDYGADILCEDQKIQQIGQNLAPPPDAVVIDAAGKYVFPGFIDPHVHVTVTMVYLRSLLSTAVSTVP